jgi:drug/metabolite transporter (DMT)-like permease
MSGGTDRSHSPEGHERASDAGVYLLLIVQSIMAGGTHIVAKMVVRDVDPVTLTLARSIVSALTVGLLLLLRGRRIRIRREDYSLIFWLSLLAIPLNQFFFLLGIHYTLPSHAALLYATTPIFVLLFSRLFLGEQLTRRKSAGVLLGFAGVALVIFENGGSTDQNIVIGNLIMLVGVLAWGLYTVFGKKLIKTYGALQASSFTMIVGTLLFLPIGIVPLMNYPLGSLSMESWGQILYLGIITSVIAYTLWYYALGRIEAGKVALFAYLQPVLTTTYSVLVLDQELTVRFILGAFAAIGGVLLAQFG